MKNNINIKKNYSNELLKIKKINKMKQNKIFLRILNRQQLKKSILKIEQSIKRFIKYNIKIIEK